MSEQLAKSIYKIPQPQVQGRPPVPPVTYSREFFANKNTFARRAQALTEMKLESPILIVGCGIGLLNEELANAGIASYGLEPSSWMWAQMLRRPPTVIEPQGMSPNPSFEHMIIKDWVESSTLESSLTRAGAPTYFSTVVDEDACTAHSDSELNEFMSGLDRLGDRVIHFVSTLNVESGPGDSSQNWKTINEWEQVAPNHTWIDLKNF